MSAKDYADDLGATVRYALETTRAIAVCPGMSPERATAAGASNR